MEKSESIKAISAALLTFHVKMEPIKKDSKNPFFSSSYASLHTILESISLPLAEAGLSFAQFPDGNSLTTILMHPDSGEWMQASYLMPVAKPNDPQAVGSSITYARRYAIGAVLGLNIEEDDDANKASERPAQATGGTQKPQDDDNRPWMTEQQFTACMKRITDGEAGVLDKAMKAMKMKKIYREQLQKEEHLQQGISEGIMGGPERF
jgi:hypothetical protein